MAAFVDAEHALDAAYAQKLGVDLEAWWSRSRQRAGARDRRSADRSGGVDVVVVDSVAALVLAPRSRAKWATRRWACRLGSCRRPSASYRCGVEIENLSDLHQPAAREDRRHVRQPRNDDRWARAEVLRLGRVDIRRIASQVKARRSSADGPA